MFKSGKKVFVYTEDNHFMCTAVIVEFDYECEFVKVENSLGRRFFVKFNEIELA